jgi:hypothetical protein
MTSGESLDFLPLSDDTDRTQRLVAVLRYSYDALEHRPEGKIIQRHFRALGTFAPEADFASRAVAALWEADEKAAKDYLQVFRARSLVSGKGGRWHQHSILRGYALHLQGHEERLRWAVYPGLRQVGAGHQPACGGRPVAAARSIRYRP